MLWKKVKSRRDGSADQMPLARALWLRACDDVSLVGQQHVRPVVGLTCKQSHHSKQQLHSIVSTYIHLVALQTKALTIPPPLRFTNHVR